MVFHHNMTYPFSSQNNLIRKLHIIDNPLIMHEDNIMEGDGVGVIIMEGA